MKIKVYDLPTRFFHWIFAGLFIAATLITKIYSDDSPVFPYHMLVGMILVLCVLLRIFWGFFGSRYAQFKSFQLKPQSVIVYFRTILKPNSRPFLGHNPASSWSALLMLGLALSLGFTGYKMVHDNGKDFYGDIHEILANTFLVVVVAHILGILLHSWRHRDGIAFSMLHGQKKSLGSEGGISSSHRGSAFVFLGIVLAFSFYIGRSYNSDLRHLQILGMDFQLGDVDLDTD